MTISNELAEIRNQLLQIAAGVEPFQSRIDSIKQAADEVHKSFSGSWAGYHSCVYYEDFEATPPYAHFSQEWGLKAPFGSGGSKGDWREFSKQEVEAKVEQLAGSIDIDEATAAADVVADQLIEMKNTVVALLESEAERDPNQLIQKSLDTLEEFQLPSRTDFLNKWHGGGQFMTRDTIVLGQGTRTPPHLELKAEVVRIESVFNGAKFIGSDLLKAETFLRRREERTSTQTRVGTNVFLGHGRSLVWRDLKDFLQDRLNVPYDEFNRVPVAGVTNITRLSEMLDSAAIAFVIMTAEDETSEGTTQARMNVIHEVGLFQGRLGFTKAIVLLEDGCEEFSNIQGLGQIRFPAGNIEAKFEEIRQVLEREGIIE